MTPHTASAPFSTTDDNTTVDSVVQPALERHLSIDQSSASAPSSILSSNICVNGIVPRNLTWAEICVIVEAGRLELLGRRQEQIDVYWQYRDEKLKELVSLADDIVTKKFGTRLVRDEQSQDKRLRAVIADLFDTSRQWPPATKIANHHYYTSEAMVIQQNAEQGSKQQRVPLVWCPNDFGYALENGVHHLLLWCPVACDEDTIHAVIDLELPAGEWEYMHFVNPPHLQSVRNLWHAHVFARRRKQPQDGHAADGVTPNHTASKSPMASNLQRVG